MSKFKNKKVLLIDDNPHSREDIITILNEVIEFDKGDYPLIHKDNPESGIKEMNHSFDIVFIDYIFDNNDLTGADIGIQIRKKYPLAILILITAFGKEKIDDYIHVGFDSYIEKDSGREKPEDLFRKAIEKGEEKSQLRIKSKFTDEELCEDTKFLNTLNKAVELTINHKTEKANNESYNIVYTLLENDKNEEYINNNLKEISLYLKKNKEKVYDGIKFTTRQSINQYLKVYQNKIFVAEEPALRIRQLFKMYPNQWNHLRAKHQTIINFLNDFDL